MKTQTYGCGRDDFNPASALLRIYRFPLGVGAAVVRGKSGTKYGWVFVPGAFPPKAVDKLRKVGWYKERLDEARDAYLANRKNGVEGDSPAYPFPGDGAYSWYTPESEVESKIRYTEGPQDKAWMEERDRNYVFRLEQKGYLDFDEPKLRTEVPKLYAEVMAKRQSRRAEEKMAQETQAQQAEQTRAAQAAAVKREQEAKDKAQKAAEAEKQRLAKDAEIAKLRAEQAVALKREQEAARLSAEAKAKAAALPPPPPQPAVLQPPLYTIASVTAALQQEIVQEQQNLADATVSRLATLEAHHRVLLIDAELQQQSLVHLRVRLAGGQLDATTKAILQGKATALAHSLEASESALHQQAAQQHIKARPVLAEYYFAFQWVLNDAILSAKVVHGQFVQASDDQFTSQKIGGYLKAIGSAVPVAGVLVKVLGAIAQGGGKLKQTQMVNRLACFCTGAASLEVFAESLARELTLYQEKDLLTFSPPKQSILDRLKALGKKITSDCIDTAIKAKACQDVEKLIDAIFQEKALHPANLAALSDYRAIIIGDIKSQTTYTKAAYLATPVASLAEEKSAPLVRQDTHATVALLLQKTADLERQLAEREQREREREQRDKENEQHAKEMKAFMQRMNKERPPNADDFEVGADAEQVQAMLSTTSKAQAANRSASAAAGNDFAVQQQLQAHQTTLENHQAVFERLNAILPNLEVAAPAPSGKKEKNKQEIDETHEMLFRR